MENNRQYTISLHAHYIVNADTAEEAFLKVVNNTPDALHYLGDRADYQSARITAIGDEDEITANLEAEWRKGVLSKINTEREVF